MITDTNIFNWSANDASNLPTDGTFIGRDLPGQIRSIKSISKIEQGLRWMRYTVAPVYASSTTFTISGNLTSVFVPLLRLRLVAGTGAVSYALVVSSSHSAGTTTVTVINLSGTVPTSLAYVDLGITPTARAYTERFRYGSVTISNTDTTVNVNWESDLSLPKMPGSYAVHTTFAGSSGAIAAGSAVVIAAQGDESSFDITILVAPGAGTSVSFDWFVLYPWHTDFAIF